MRIIDSSSSMQRAVADLRTGLGTVLRRSAPGDAGVLLSGLVTGDDDGFSPERKNAFVQTGTTHLTAVSGSIWRWSPASWRRSAVPPLGVTGRLGNS